MEREINGCRKLAKQVLQGLDIRLPASIYKLIHVTHILEDTDSGSILEESNVKQMWILVCFLCELSVVIMYYVAHLLLRR